MEEETGICSRCDKDVDANTLVTYGSWELCELCQEDI